MFAGRLQRACVLQHRLPGTLCCLLLQLAEDLKSALGADSGLGGAPATDYCVLECEQWNSPLYCDHNHTQVGGQVGEVSSAAGFFMKLLAAGLRGGDCT